MTQELPERKRRCVDCGLWFVISPGEQRFFNSHRLHFPKRCQRCREAKREAEETWKRQASESRSETK